MRREGLNPVLISILVVSWMVAAFIGYIYIHKPFSTTELAGMMLACWQVLVAVTIISLAGGIGILTNLRDLDVPPLTLAALTVALGLGILGIVVLVVGATIGVNAFLWVLLVGGIILLRNQILLWWKYWLGAGEIYSQAGKLGRIIFILVAAILFCQFIIALAPPLWFDTLTYHVAIPKEFIQLGRIVYVPNNMEWGMVRQTEILYTLAMFTGGTETATVLGWALGALTLVAFADFTGKIFNQDSAWVAVASLMCGPALAGLLSSGYVEWETILFGLAMLICLLQWTMKPGRQTLYMAGLFAGMAFATKYTAGIALIAGATVILFFQRPYSVKKVILNLALFGCIALVTTLPWLIKNILATSNPFYPLFIPGGAMDKTRLAFFQAEQLKQDWSRLILLPWQITVWGIDGSGGFAASIGPLLLGLSPLALINRQNYNLLQRRVIAVATIILLTTFLIWAVGSEFSENLMQTRYYLVNFPAWALLCAAGYFTISQIRLGEIHLKNLAAALILLALAFSVFGSVVTLISYNPLLTLLRLEPREAYIRNNLGPYGLAMETLKTLPKNARVLMLWETRSFECLPGCDPDEILDRWYYDWHTYHNSNAVIASWKEQGYTYILINRAGAAFIRENDPNNPNTPEYWDGLDATLHLLTKIKDIGGGYELYALP